MNYTLGRLILLTVAAHALAACGGGGGGGGGGAQPQVNSYTIGGSLSGLNGSGLVLANAGQTLSVSSGATSFTFATAVTSGTAYAVTVQTQPSGEQCTVSSGSGTATANVTSVSVTCVANKFKVGGSIQGLSASGLVLSDGTETVSPAASATTFTFPTALATGASFTVTVTAQPAGQSCAISAGSGTIGTADVTSVQVSCSATKPQARWVATTLSTSGAYPLLASDPSTNSVVVGWSDLDQQAFNVSRFAAATGWGNPVTVAGVTRAVGMGFDQQGNGHLLYNYDVNRGGEAYYTAGTGWSAGLPMTPFFGPPSGTSSVVPPTSFTSAIGLAVFGDGSAAARIEHRVTYYNADSSFGYNDDEFWIAAATPGHVLAETGAADGAVPANSTTLTTLLDKNNNPYQALVQISSVTGINQAPSVHFYSEQYAADVQASNGTTRYTGVVLILPSGTVSVHQIAGTLGSTYTKFQNAGVAMSDNGTALVTWALVSSDGSNVSYYAQRFNGTTWDPIVTLETDTGDTSDYSAWRLAPVAAINASGDGIVVFPVFSGFKVVRMHGATGAFDSAFKILDDNKNDAGAVVGTVMDAAGNAFVAHVPGSAVAVNNNYSVKASRLAAGASAFDSDTAGGLVPGIDPSYYGLIIDRSGAPTLVWAFGVTVSVARYQ